MRLITFPLGSAPHFQVGETFLLTTLGMNVDHVAVRIEPSEDGGQHVWFRPVSEVEMPFLAYQTSAQAKA